ncbi:MAG TPA: hypothetical protein PLS49_04215 [Candidatus Woesebacteria bacterium]|nr:hypothetical protein [Candidatus Woesebacteria bacterium]
MKNKKHIEEEETYRAQLRAKIDNTTPTKKNGMSGCLVVIIVFAILLVICFMAINPMFEEAEKNANTPQDIKVEKDSYQSWDGNTYTYQILYEEGTQKYVATFTPFIPRSDKNLVEAIFRVFARTYGNDAQINPEPILKTIEGKTFITFRSNNENYYVFPIKEDTGEVHSFTYWKE